MATPTLMSNEAAIYLILAEVAVHWRRIVSTLTTGSLSWAQWSSGSVSRFHTTGQGSIPGQGRILWGRSGASHLSSPFANFNSRRAARGLAARRLFKVPPYCEDTIHLQTSISSPGFKPRTDGTAVSVANHYTGWATSFNVDRSLLCHFPGRLSVAN
ncbi:hypothetical protein TNCV_5041401 [Trichonephila clavipes]|nr:hypothetical protein TNCV_5041401 [Trichonephila clavipes]